MSCYPVHNNTPVAKQVDSIYESHLDQFLSEGEYKKFNLPHLYDHQRIDHSIKDVENDPSRGYVNLKVYSVPNLKRPNVNEIIGKVDFEQVAYKGDVFGPSWTTFWVQVEIRIPDAWSDYEQVIFEWDCDNEGLVYTEDRQPAQAFSGSERTEYILPEQWQRDHNIHIFYIEMACNGMFGCGSTDQIAPPDPDRYFVLKKADLVVPNLQARALRCDFMILQQSAKEFPSSSWQKFRARQLCNEIMNKFLPEEGSSIEECRSLAKLYLGEHIDSENVEETNTNQTKVYAVGHCHIDTAWLWPFAETRRKIVRSWTTQLNLLDRYPEYRFVCSQAQQYEWLKEDHPETYERLKKYVASQRFLPIGGSWVEHDTNLPCGESLIRQFLFGQRFFKSEFDIYCDTFWLPDTFGYSSQIPQICRLAGMSRFLTQKLSWNNINSFPHTTFNWVALDGSQVLCHMPPADTYTADTNVSDIIHSVSQHKNLANDQAGLLVFGIGDGGGGPTPEMLEKLRRCKGVANTVGLLPDIKFGNSVDDFFDGIFKRTSNAATLPSWVGELYFEFHRGTYVTQSELKSAMRKAEFSLHDLEYFATLAFIRIPNFKYPFQEINQLWKTTLLCQFHDVLPGSCIQMVYDDAIPMMQNVFQSSEKLIKNILDQLGFRQITNHNILPDYLLSTLPWNVGGVVDESVQASPVSFYEANKNPNILARSDNTVKHPARAYESNGCLVLRTDKLLVRISKAGLIKSIHDLENDREVLDLKSGINKTGANQYVIFQDTPLSFPAWDTEIFSLDKYRLLTEGKAQLYETGPLKASVLVETPISENSSIKTIISLSGFNNDADRPSVDFSCEVDWHEDYKFLKVEFPVDIHAEYASYETQFGITRRPTHYNTSWDIAKFEVCHHKFADYSEYNYGVSIMNDCKYGFSVHGNLMRLSLLRSPKQPDAHADMGKHYFRYSLLPHKGGLSPEIVRAAYKLNSLFRFVNKNSIETNTEALDFIRVEGDESIILSNVKKAEDENAIIIRIYESLGGKSRCRLTLRNCGIKSATKCNILEEDIGQVNLQKDEADCSLQIELRAFEIASFKLTL
ncbi:alpha-mannosidase [Schizosaccharomyces cryophilus OY26]|uniref:Alpha-mannosidase n=1 Tax=Schizosaccharomyces cryophilus (strain OY26 / ATCC MYA-4695 / CBS 11777 / NBRC 106824 / NRRL Y48691) TaxID=653667 RepID=S9W024_SCHCR|nr:alpha-mannosidase [Schizosaccharomyces cryophilus OY26]EPY53293.1 alpha-mannosidase [Schizosaccharomyces cryophilus OY26]